MKQIAAVILVGVIILAGIAVPQFAMKWALYHERVGRIKQYSTYNTDKVFWVNGASLDGWITFEDYSNNGKPNQNNRYFHNGKEL